MPKKVGRYAVNLSVVAIAVIYALQYFNAFGRDKNRDIFNADDLSTDRLMQLFMAMSILFAGSQVLEIYDHLPNRTHHHAHGDETEVKQERPEHKEVEPVPPETSGIEEEKSLSVVEGQTFLSRYEKVGRGLGGLTALALSGFALLALWQESSDLARGNLPGGIFIFSLSAGRFLLLPGRHAFALVTGRQKQLMHAITEHSRPEQGVGEHQHEMMTSPVLQAGVFTLYTLSHIADSTLLADHENTKSEVYWLSVIGLSASVACYHLTHTLNIKSAYRTLKNLPSPLAKIAGTGAALVVGGLHASQTVLGLMALLKQPQKWLLVLQGVAVSVEFVTGFLSAAQHTSQRVGLWIARCSRSQAVLPSLFLHEETIPAPLVSEALSSSRSGINPEIESKAKKEHTSNKEEGGVVHTKSSYVEMQPLSSHVL